MAFEMTVGSRAQVWHGTAKHTSGGLTKTALLQNKSGRIVSRKKHASAKRDNRLVKAGFKTKKGSFGFVKVGSRKRGHKKGLRGGFHHVIRPAFIDDENQGSTAVQMRAGMGGGSPYGNNFAPENLDGQGDTNYGGNSTNVQMEAGQAGGKRRRRKMRGGTTKPFADLNSASPLNRALGAA
jgi:hypothetical protein